MLHKIAKTIRVLTVPPVMVAALLTVLYYFDNVFPTLGDYWLSLLFLAIVPVLAYPFQKLVPKLREGGRKTQRNLAFVFSIFGYGGAVLSSILRGAIPNLLYISVVYLLSVIILSVINLLTPWRASGHGCSIMGPLFLLCLFIGWQAIPIGVILYAASLWASLYMKRHTLREFILGSLCAVFSAVVCIFIFHPIF